MKITTLLCNKCKSSRIHLKYEHAIKKEENHTFSSTNSTQNRTMTWRYWVTKTKSFLIGWGPSFDDQKTVFFLVFLDEKIFKKNSQQSQVNVRLHNIFFCAKTSTALIFYFRFDFLNHFYTRLFHAWNLRCLQIYPRK